MSNNPIRVLHSFGSLGKGGIETWLMNILRVGSKDVKFDFCLGLLGGAYEAEARSLGCTIHHAPPIRRLRENMSFLEKILRDNKYDVLHVHGEEFMGDAMKAAAKAGTPVRIAHCHNTILARGKKNFEMKIRAVRFKTLDRMRILKYATNITACSTDAGRFLMGDHWEKDARCSPLFCGIPLEQFHRSMQTVTREQLRKTHRIPDDAIVIGHAGSMGPSLQKNHLFIVEIFRELAKRNDRYYLFLAGDGPLRPRLDAVIEEYGLGGRVIMPGLCDDVPSLMVHAFDVHLLPSLQEGLPIVGLEAVASGLYTVCSDTITKDYTDAFSQRVATVPLQASPSVWADRVEQAMNCRIATPKGVELIENGPFSIQASLMHMLKIYREQLRRAG